ncbi:MAG: CPBP family intramembrane glutamic endopeptidase, partial [Pseudomonadota bacterium]
MIAEGPQQARDPIQVGAREALIAAVTLVVMLGVLKQLAFTPLLQKIGFTLAAGFQLYVPLWLIDRRRQRTRDYGIHMHGSLGAPMALLRRRVLQWASSRPRGSWWRRRALGFSHWLSAYAHHAQFDRQGFSRDVGLATGLCLLTFPFFAVGHHFWQLFLASRHGRHATYQAALPADFFEILVVNLLLVALPEELFYRGFVQTRLVKAWPPWLVRFGVPLGWAIVVTSGLFALGHYAGEWGNPARLGPF